MKSNINVNFEEIDKILADIIKTVDPSIKQYLKQYFENNLLNFYNGTLELSLIIDANIIISNSISYIKNNKSFLLELSKSPFLKLLAPLHLKEELKNKIPEISKKQKLNENKIKEVFDLFLEKITFITIEDTNYAVVSKIMGERDKKDVPYIACYLSIKSHGIITGDKDILDIPEIKTWENPGSVGKVVTTFEKGALSFFIVGEGLPLICKLIYETLVLVLRSIWEVVITIGNLIYTLIKEGITVISKLPDWVKIMIGASVLFLIIWNKSREVIITLLQSFAHIIISILVWLYKAIKDILNLIAPLIETGILLLSFFFTKIEETINAYEQINQ
jgi:predicted nucleic acid-binding protein